jgi:hypothetical protein
MRMKLKLTGNSVLTYNVTLTTLDKVYHVVDGRHDDKDESKYVNYVPAI